MKRKLFVLVFISFSFFIQKGFAQNDASNNNAGNLTIEKKELKNTIFYNITNTLIFGGKAQVIGYERVLSDNKSVTIEGGTFSLPSFTVLSSKYKANEAESQKGIKLAADFRFYPASENKFHAPRGVYVGPYISYNYFNRTKSFDIDTSTVVGSVVEVTVNTDFTFRTITGGLQLGYQFVFWRRLAVDLVLIGPGITSYKVNAKFDTSLEADQESDLFEALNDKLAEKIPGYSLVIKPADFESTGSTNTTSIGFRYLVHVGFRF